VNDRDDSSREPNSRPVSTPAAELREQASYVRHELRGALAVMYPALSALRAGELSADQQRLVDAGERAAARLDQIIASFGDTGWLEMCSPALEPSAVDLPAIVETSLRSRTILAGPGSPTFLADLPRGLPAVWADEARLRAVLGALLDNAARFSPPGGVVRVSAAASPAAGGAASHSAREVRVTVSDRGPGVDAAELEAIFAFGQRGANNPEGWAGLGIGLYACRVLVASWGGSIAAELAGQHGLAVRFTAPVAVGNAGPG
jgi:two-component system sensor histidine kinase KdpD